MNRAVLVWTVALGTFVVGCLREPRAAEPRTPPRRDAAEPRTPPRPDAAPAAPTEPPRPPPAPPQERRPPDAAAPAGRRPPAAKNGDCMSSQQCPQGQHCSVEDGACNRPPGCGPNDICTMVCWGTCTGAAGRPGGAANRGGKRVRCGKRLCPAGQVCCNESCAICTPPDGVCTKQLCGEPGGPKSR